MRGRAGCSAAALATPVAVLLVLLVPPATAAVAFDAVPAWGEVPLEVRFTDRTGPNPSDWRWDFEGDGTIDSTLQNPTHRYAAPGNYRARLTARFHTDPDPDSGSTTWGNDTYEQVIVVLPSPPTPFPPPVADFSVAPEHGPAPLLVAFQGRIDDQGGPGRAVRWTWEFGDGSPAAEGQSVDHRFITPGRYRARLTVVFRGPTSPVSDTGDVQVNVTAEHTITVDAARLELDAVEELARGDPLEVTGATSLAPGEDLLVEIVPASYRPADTERAGNVGGATGTIRVTAGGGAPNAFRFTADTSGFGPGTYTATVRAVDTDATATTTFSLVERLTDTPTAIVTTVTTTPTASPPIAPATPTPTPPPVLATPTTLAAASPSTSTTPSVPPTPPTPPTSLTPPTSSAPTPPSASPAPPVLGTPPGSPPAAAFTWAPDPASGLKVQFTDTSTGDVTTRRWEFGDGNVSLDEHPFHVYPGPGAYAVRLAVEGPGGASSASRAVAVRGTGTPPVTPTATATTVVPTATGGGGGDAFPWWIAAVAAVGLLAGGAALVKFGPGASPPVKTVPGLTIEPRGRLRRPATGRETRIEIEVRGGIRRER